MKTARRSLKTKIIVFALLVSMVFSTFSVSASTQVDINTATLEELQQITGVGSVIGQRIIDGRPYASVDDLINVSGIGTATLQKIKDQGIAYVPAKDTSGKVDINNATLEELQQITGVGAAIAQRMIDARPYESVDDLSKVSGIGAATLQKIKDQGLAYVVIEEKEVIEKIDINTASLADLQKITGIGSVIAQRVIDGRPYNSLDDLINVSGIGTVTLQKIKDQGLAYVVEAEKPETPFTVNDYYDNQTTLTGTAPYGSTVDISINNVLFDSVQPDQNGVFECEIGYVDYITYATNKISVKNTNGDTVTKKDINVKLSDKVNYDYKLKFYNKFGKENWTYSEDTARIVGQMDPRYAGYSINVYLNVALLKIFNAPISYSAIVDATGRFSLDVSHCYGALKYASDNNIKTDGIDFNLKSNDSRKIGCWLFNSNHVIFRADPWNYDPGININNISKTSYSETLTVSGSTMYNAKISLQIGDVGLSGISNSGLSAPYIPYAYTTAYKDNGSGGFNLTSSIDTSYIENYSSNTITAIKANPNNIPVVCYVDNVYNSRRFVTTYNQNIDEPPYYIKTNRYNETTIWGIPNSTVIIEDSNRTYSVNLNDEGRGELSGFTYDSYYSKTIKVKNVVEGVTGAVNIMKPNANILSEYAYSIDMLEGYENYINLYEKTN